MCGLACHAHCRGLTIKRKSLHLLSPRIQEGGFQRPCWINLLDAGQVQGGRVRGLASSDARLALEGQRTAMLK